jgi:DNA/RNA-binding domain of Phe-tRNA-synthetase-like protein
MIDMLQITERWKTTFPETAVGAMMVSVAGDAAQDSQAPIRHAVENMLREQYISRAQLQAHPVIAAYTDYYNRFRKTYHVLLQAESVALKGKGILSPNPLVGAMFICELKNFLLTAVHDSDAIRFPLMMDAAQGDETYTLMRQELQQIKTGDMLLKDQKEILGCIVYGPDYQTRILPESKHAIYIVYGVPKITGDMIRVHFADIRQALSNVWPQVQFLGETIIEND